MKSSPEIEGRQLVIINKQNNYSYTMLGFTEAKGVYYTNVLSLNEVNISILFTCDLYILYSCTNKFTSIYLCQ